MVACPPGVNGQLLWTHACVARQCHASRVHNTTMRRAAEVVVVMVVRTMDSRPGPVCFPMKFSSGKRLP